MKLQVGLVGIGDDWNARRRPALLALGDRFEVRAVCTEVAVRGEQAARDVGAQPVDGFRAMAARADIDALLVLARQWYDPLPILAACDAGKAVYCAPALEIDPQRAHDLKLRVERSGVAFMAELPCRLAPATQRLKELIATRLGAPRLLFCHRRVHAPAGNGKYRKFGEPADDVTMRGMMESVDWCRYVVGQEPTSVVGVRHGSEAGAADDYHMLSLDFSRPSQPIGSGPMAQVSWSAYTPNGWPEAVNFRSPAGLQVCCEHGVAFVDLPSKLIWFDSAGQHAESLEAERPVDEQLLTHFHRAVTSLVRKTSDLDDAYRALRIVLAARESAASGRRVPLEF